MRRESVVSARSISSFRFIGYGKDVEGLKGASRSIRMAVLLS